MKIPINNNNNNNNNNNSSSNNNASTNNQLNVIGARGPLTKLKCN